MERKKLRAGLIAIAMGFAFSVGGASAYEQGDMIVGTAARGKLIPYYMAGEDMATIIGVNNLNATPNAAIIEIAVHNVGGGLQATGQLCLTANGFGYAILQEGEPAADGSARAELVVGVRDSRTTITGPGSGANIRAGSSAVATPAAGSMIRPEGFVVVREMATVANTATLSDACDKNDGDTGYTASDFTETTPSFQTWAVLQDVGEGAFGTEIPSATVQVAARNSTTQPDGILCTTPANCAGLVALGEDVWARFDVSMSNDSGSMIYLWLDSAMGFAASGRRERRVYRFFVSCEGSATSTPVDMNVPDQINMIDADDLGCSGRGVATVSLPGTGGAGLIWSHIMQMGGGFRMNMPGYATAP